ncbi:NAD(P)/FAD-dependent oxidoreductase [Streptomyces sp. NPDC057654]|uniref:NAD(P)/FAD-dependent oxidoreductase n=1 Tax=Streptomyces sp. NPDC057654 TaxID=3346196 RepID=UPI0036C92EE5
MQRAVVLGGSIAGLMAARVLSDHADDVVIVERDGLGPADTGRPGVPQIKQLHVVLEGGRLQMERWFPGLTAELIADGAVPSEGDAIEHYFDGVLKVPVAEETTIGLTRPFLEGRIRDRVLGRDNVRLVPGLVRGLLFERGKARGVRFAPGGAEDATETETLTADLVVDATGRSSRVEHWLKDAGWQPPRLDRMRIDLRYTTALFERGDELPGVAVVQSLSAPAPAGTPQHDFGVAAEVEGGRWMVVLSAYGQPPNRDAATFVKRVRDTPGAPFAKIAGCRLDSDVETYQMADSRRRTFTGLDRFPAGLVVVGDAFASFNPIYGQGMSSAALHASCLSAFLCSGERLDEPAWGYFRRAEVVVDAAWGLSTLGDLALPHVMGPYPRGYRLTSWYVEKLVTASMTDAEVNRRYLAVAHMREHPRVLTGPSTMWAVARTLRARRRAPAPAPAS